MSNRPPGFRFFPTEEELVGFYLRNKLERRNEEKLDLVIPVVDIYNLDPWDLPSRSGELCSGDEEWFFFSPRQEREAHGGRPNRITPSGYWKATGTPGFVYSANNRIIGMKRTMVFYEGKAPKGNKTKWKVNEFKVLDEASTSSAPPQFRHEMSVCRIYVTSGSVRSFDRRPFVAGINEMLQREESNRVMFDTRIYNSEGASSSHSAEPSQENRSIEEQARNTNCPQEEGVLNTDLKMMDDDLDDFWNLINSE